MPAEPTNRDLLSRWHEGDEVAAQILVDRYLARLTTLARSRLSRRLARRLDAEDIALSAWRSFFVATGRGRVTVPEDDNLWPLLVTMTLRKLARQAARHQAEQRDVDREVPLPAASNWMAAVATDPRPEEAAALIDELEHLMSHLSPQDRDIVSRRLQGESPSSIAVERGCSERTVRRAMVRFREVAEQRQADAVGETGKPIDYDDLPAATATAPPSEAVSWKPTYEFGELVLQQIIGQGGFSKLYRAHDRRQERTVAVKFLRKSLWRDQRAINALLQETRVVSQLSHAGIIRHHGWGRTDAGAVFIVMEWIDGCDLSALMRRGRLSIVDSINYGLRVTEALVAAHAAGIVHGDVTPSNVLLDPSGRVVLTDFGFATMVLQNPHCPRGGTPGFLAPEQVSEAFGSIDERTDVYGFGGLMYALLTGEPPMTGHDIPEILAGVLSSRPARDVGMARTDVPIALATLVRDCLQKEAGERPASMAEVCRRLGDSQRR